MIYDPIEITKLYVFGTTNPSSSNYNDHIRPLGPSAASKTYDMGIYMTGGGGRYAYPSLFPAVQKFFHPFNIIPDGNYTYADMVRLGYLQQNDDYLGISQYGTDIANFDHAERSYIFGSTGFSINTNDIRFNVTGSIGGAGGVRSISNLEIRANEDNFDFRTNNLFAQAVGGILASKLDPFGLGRGEVDINFTGKGKEYSVYDRNSYLADQNVDRVVSVIGTVSGVAMNAQGIANLGLTGLSYLDTITSDTFLSYRRNGLQVVYGTPTNDTLQGLLSTTGSGSNLLGGVGDDTLIGYRYNDQLEGSAGNDNLKGNDGDDYLDGGYGDDSLLGGNGDDYLDGGYGIDTIDGGSGSDTIKFDPNDKIVQGAGDKKASGGEGDDIVFGSTENDTIDGGSDNDFLGGGLGNDRLDGGLGNDLIAGDEGDDTIDGNEGDDAINGDDGSDIIDGGEGDDAIYGGTGNNTVYGGSGEDIFALTPGGMQIISDFVDEMDRITPFAVGNFNSLALQQDGGDVLVSHNGELTAIIKGIEVDKLTRVDFMEYERVEVYLDSPDFETYKAPKFAFAEVIVRSYSSFNQTYVGDRVELPNNSFVHMGISPINNSSDGWLINPNFNPITIVANSETGFNLGSQEGRISLTPENGATVFSNVIRGERIDIDTQQFFIETSTELTQGAPLSSSPLGSEIISAPIANIIWT